VSFRTERLQLRSATLADVAPFHRILADPRAMTYWSTPPHRTIAETDAWVRAMIAIPPGEGEDFVVEHDGAVIGKAGLYRFPRIGFLFHPDHWGRGFASEALRFVIDRAVARRLSGPFPFGTLAVNVSGATLLGFLGGLALSHWLALLAGTAFVGSYTTFSTWMLETQRLTEERQLRPAIMNIVVSVAFGLLAAWLGQQIGARL